MSHNIPSDFAQRISMPVRWGDMDRLGHVNNARFFSYDEDGRIAYFDSLLNQDERFWKDYGIILASIGCDFIAQLRYPATLEIGTRITRMGRSSLGTQSVMFWNERPVAVVKGVVVWFDYQNQKSLPIPEAARELIRAREIIKPEESL
jgi:acyl-CoA thioester hydrolase